MSDTPKTDAAVFAVDVAFTSHDGLASEPKEVVEPDFARQLERENANLIHYYIKELSRALAATKKDRDGLEAALLARVMQHSDSMRDWAKQSAAFKIRVGMLERDNAALLKEIAPLRETVGVRGDAVTSRDDIDYWSKLVDRAGKADQLERENAVLREDKERLDWLARNRSVSATERPLSVTLKSLRAAIDAARAKEAKP